MQQDDTSAVERLQHGDLPARLAAAQWLAQHPAAPAAVALVGALADNFDEVRQWVSEALENLGPPAADHLADLLRFVHSQNEDQVYWAATLIGRLGPRGRSAAMALSQLVANHPSLNVRNRAQWALKAIEFTAT